jgi:hypothetical protein
MHAQDFQEPNEDIIWTKHQENQEGTPKCDTTKGYPNYIKEPNQHMIDSKVQHKNYIKTNEHKENQNTHAQRFISFKKVKQL